MFENLACKHGCGKGEGKMMVCGCGKGEGKILVCGCGKGDGKIIIILFLYLIIFGVWVW